MNTIDYSKFKIAKGFQHLDPTMWQANDISAGFSSIRYRGKSWSLLTGGKQYAFIREDDKTPLSYIDVVILGINQHTSKTYFGPEAWNEDSTGGPICQSIKGDQPDPSSTVPQSKACGVCPHNEWGSKKGGGGKACQDHKRMAMLLMPTMTRNILPQPLLEPVFFKLPPGSFKTWKSYSDDMIQQGIPLAAMITRLSFSPPPKTFEIKFEPVQALSEKEVPVVLPLMESRETKSILGTAPQVRQIAPAAPKPPERIETGLLEAFSQQTPQDEDDVPGQEVIPPPRAAKRPRAVKAAVPPQELAAPADNGGDEPWEESDTDLDDSVRSLMGDKLNNMLKGLRQTRSNRGRKTVPADDSPLGYQRLRYHSLAPPRKSISGAVVPVGRSRYGDRDRTHGHHSRQHLLLHLPAEDERRAARSRERARAGLPADGSRHQAGQSEALPLDDRSGRRTV